MRRTWLLLMFNFCFLAVQANPTPVEKFGKLRVEGNQIVDKNGQPVQLRGVSLFWSQWMGKFYNEKAVAWLAKDWSVNVIRVAMAVDNRGYATNKSEQRKAFTVIDAAIKNGIYVIVDFHVHDGDRYLAEAKDFFSVVAQRYGSLPNVIYEPWNEPVNHAWSKVIKPYHEAVVEVIRKHDPDNLIILGTRTWSQDVEEASLDPVRGVNLAYVLHFYAATHKSELREKAKRALANGIALMVSEYGTCESTGNGVIDTKETEAWWRFLDDNKISHCNWSLADKRESASIVKPGADPHGSWTEEQLTPSGKMVRAEIRAKNK